MGQLAILKEQQWIVWAYDRDGRKCLYDRHGDRIGSTWTQSFMSHEEAEEVSQRLGSHGVAFCFTSGDEYCGIDLDDCLLEVMTDAEGRIVSKSIKDWALPILESFRGAWIEFSPSMTGLKIFCRAKKQDPRSQTIVADATGERLGSIEVYDHGRAFAFTGLAFAPYCGEDIPQMDEALQLLYGRYFGSCNQAEHVGSLQVRERVVVAANGSSRLRERAIAYLAAIPVPGIGERNNALFRATGHVAAIAGDELERLSDSEILQIMLDFNDRLPNPLETREVMSVVRSNLASATPRAVKVSTRDLGTELAGVTLPEWALAGSSRIAGSSVLPASTAPLVDEIPEPKELPSRFWEIGGFLGAFVAEHEATCFWHQPALALAAAIALQATLCGRKIRDPFGARPNVYVLGVSGSATGKEHARSLSMRILDAVGEWSRLGDLTKPKSAAGIGARLLQHPARLALIDEFGMFLGRHTRHGSGWKSDVDEALLELYSASGTKWSRGNYGDATVNWEVERPCLSVYGTTTPETLWKSMSVELISSGLLGRMLVVFGKFKPDPQYELVAERAPAEHLVDHARAWISQGGELAGTPFAPEVIAGFAAGAQERLEEIRRDLIERAASCDDPLERPTLSRALGSVQKLALIRAASESASSPTITTEALEWARELVEWLTAGIVAIARHRTVESSFQGDQNDVLDYLRMRGGSATRSELVRRFRRLRAKELAEVLSVLEHAGMIRIATETGSGRPVCVVAIAGLLST